MPDPAEVQTPMPAHQRRVFAVAVVRGLSILTVLVVVYFLLPLDEMAKLPFGVIVAGGVVILSAVTVLEVRSTIRAVWVAPGAEGAGSTSMRSRPRWSSSAPRRAAAAGWRNRTSRAGS